MATEHYVAWWNVENLFDSSGSEDRPDWLKSKLRSELKGWTTTIRDKKIKQLAKVIKRMNDGRGPDFMGVCEVENATVMNLLASAAAMPDRDYKVIHKDTSDARGIDIAFIYDANLYDFDPKTLFSFEVMKRFATRDLVQITMTVKATGNEFVVIGNHWPSRSGGQFESEPYRIIVGETLSYWTERIIEERSKAPAGATSAEIKAAADKGKNTPIVLMGDFNDTPYNRALREYALSVPTRSKVVYGRNPYYLNLMWPLMGEGEASYVFDSQPLMIDQMLVNKSIAKVTGDPFTIDDDAARIVNFEDLNMTKGRYGTPIRFGRPSSGLDEEGYSDHLPIAMILKEKD